MPLELHYPRPDTAVITLNRPEKLNALSSELVEALQVVENRSQILASTGGGVTEFSEAFRHRRQ